MWKTDSLGNTVWFNTYGGTTNERAYEGQQTSDSGYVIVGDSLASNDKAWMIKTDKDGNFIWGRTIGTHFYSNHYTGRAVQQLSNGEYVMCGTHRYLVYPGSYAHEYSLSRISSTGDSISYRYYGMYGYAVCPSVRKLTNDNLLIGGSYLIGGNNFHPWILKTTYTGNIIWQQSITGSQTPVELTALELTIDGGFIMTVGSFGGSAVQDFQLLKCDANGILSWEKIIGGSQDDRAYSVSQTMDDGYIVTGYTKSFGAGDSDIWLLKFKYNPPPEITVVTPNGGEYWLMGDTVDIKWTSVSVDSVKIQLSLNDGIDWIPIVESTASDSVYKWVVQASSTSWSCQIKISDASDSTIYDVSDTTFTIDMFPAVDDSTNSILPTEFALFQNYPNPFNPVTKIKFSIPSVTLRQAQSDSWVTLKVYDVLGNEIATLVNEEQTAGTYEVEFNTNSHSGEGRNLTSGIYFYQLQVVGPETSSGQGIIETKKMVLIK